MNEDDQPTQLLPVYGDDEPTWEYHPPTSKQDDPPPPPSRRGCGCSSCLGRAFLFSVFGLLVIGAVLMAAVYWFLSSSLSDELQDGVGRLAQARNRDVFQTTVITDRNGETMWEIFGEGKRTFVSIDAIPPEVIEATISVEDDSFYTNKGFDETSLVAAMIANFRNRNDGRPIGGSTITQQIVRHVAFDYEERTAVSYRRKVKELFLAWRMTQDFSKREILEMYLNEIYYGNLAYGIEAAAQTYFDKPASDLTLGEASLLAGLPQFPVGLDPYTNLEGARGRQWFILTLMVDDGVITLDQANEAYLEQLVLADQEVSLSAPHFSVWVRQQLEDQFGAELVANGGLRVTTTLDLEYQQVAERLAREHVAALQANNLNNASLVAIKPGTGEIMAMLGSVDYHNDAIDGRVNVALSLQQPGSTIKALTFAAAMQPNPDTGKADWSPADIVWDVPVVYPQVTGDLYVPVNYDSKFHGPIRLREALANSYNIPALLLLQDIGVERLLSTAAQLGITTFDPENNYYGLAVTLGGAEVKPLEITGAFATFANQGAYVPPFSILKVETSDGQILYEHEAAEPERVLDARVAYAINDFLSDDIARLPAMGQNNPLELPFAAAAKTGTTNDFRDNWTIGYSPGLAVGVWAGNTDNTPMINVSGLSGAAPLWQDFMLAVHTDPALKAKLAQNGAAPPDLFVQPAGIERQPVCGLASVVAGAADCNWDESELLFVQTDEPAPSPFQIVSPGVVRAMLAPGEGAWVDGQPNPTCVVNADVNSVPQEQKRGINLAGAYSGLFLLPPRNEESVEKAYQWGSAAGYAMLPTELCFPEVEDSAVDIPLPPAEGEPTNTPWPTNTPDESKDEDDTAVPTNTPWPTAVIAPPTQAPADVPAVAATPNWAATATQQAWQSAPTNTPWPSPTPWPTNTPVPNNSNNQPAATNTPQPWPTNTPPPVQQQPTAIPIQPTAIPPTAVPIQPTAIPPTAVPPTQAPAPVTGNAQNGALWVITSPVAGQTLSSDIPIMGTARFNDDTQFYKVELRKAGGAWVTLGNTHAPGVENGRLENLSVSGLLGTADWGAGQYELRLVLIQSDGNYVGTPFTVAITLQ